MRRQIAGYGKCFLGAVLSGSLPTSPHQNQAAGRDLPVGRNEQYLQC